MSDSTLTSYYRLFKDMGLWHDCNEGKVVANLRSGNGRHIWAMSRRTKKPRKSFRSSRFGLRLDISENNLITTPTFPVKLPLHPNLGILAQRRRAPLCQAHEAAIERGVFESAVDLKAAINRLIVEKPPSRNPSHGLLTPIALSSLSDAGATC